MAAQNSSSQKLKFSEWRPIGVCDSAPPGIQKAQTFTREDFLIVTAPGVDRTNWQSHPEIMTILQRYCAKLGKQSTKTSGMKKPVVSKIKLVGAVMKLAITPTLNKESKDGKLQFFQVKFEDKGVTKKRSLKWLIGILLAILVTLCIILGIAIYEKLQKKQYRPRRMRSQTYTLSYCEKADNLGRYARHLDEVNRILQIKTDDLFYKGRIAAEMKCDEDLPNISFKEERFLKCYRLIKRQGMLSQMPYADLKKVKACQREICSRNQSSHIDGCQRE